MAKVRIDKFEAARRQINAAIRMLFTGEDPVAIYTIAMAGFRILEDLSSRQDENEVQKAMETALGPNNRENLKKKIYSDASFLKHADRDPDKIHDGIEEEANDWILYLASLYYQQLGNPLTPEMYALIAWLSKLHPDAPKSLLKYVNPRLGAATDAADDFFGTTSRKEQLAFGLELLKLAYD